MPCGSVPQATPETYPYDVTCLEEDASGEFDWCKECSRLIEYFKTDNQVPNYISVNVANHPYYYHGPPAKWLAQCELQIGLKQSAIYGVVDRTSVAQAAASIVKQYCVGSTDTLAGSYPRRLCSTARGNGKSDSDGQ